MATVALVLSSALLFGVLEGGIRLAAPQRTRMEMLNGESLAIADSVIGHRLRPGAVAVDHSLEFTARYVVNEQGHRDAAVYDASRAKLGPRLLLLGDSFAFGVGEDYDHIFPVIVERTLTARGRPVEVVKAGVPGFDTRVEVLYLQRLLAETAADGVILTFLPNDLFTNDPLQPRLDDRAVSPAPAVAVRADEKAEGIHVVTLLKRLLMSNDRLYGILYRRTPRRQYFEVPWTPEVQSRMAATVTLLREAARFCGEHGAPLIVLSIPQQFQVIVEGRGFRYEGTDVHFIDRELGKLAEEEGFSFIPLLEPLARTYRETGDDLYFRWDGHLNRRGNQVVGEVFADRLDSLMTKW